MKAITLLTIISFSIAGYSQNIHFVKSFGNNGYDYGRDIKQDLDTGYIATGSSSSFSSLNADAFLLKIDSLGNFKWSYNYGGPGSEWGESVVVTNDSSYAIAGHSNSAGAGGFDFYLVRAAADGVPLWEKYYGGSDWDKAYDLVQLSDSGFVLVGETYSYGNGNNDIYIVRTDKNGDTLWTRTYGGIEADYANAVIADGDSIVVVGGTESFGNGMSDGIILKYHIDGTLGWFKTAGMERGDYFTSITKHNDQYYLSGSRLYYFDQTGYLDDFWIYQMTSDANSVIADTSISGGSHEVDIAYDLFVNENDHIFYVGSTKSFGVSATDLNPDAYIGRFLPSYTHMNYIKQFGVAGTEDLRAVDRAYDKGYIAIGNTEFLSTGGNNVLIVKVDENTTTVKITVTTELVQDSITLSIEDDISSPSFKLYPVPITNILTIEGISSENYEISVYNMNGQIIMNTTNENQIDFSKFKNGNFIIEIKTADSVYRKRIVKI